MPTALDVVREALIQPIPCPACGSTQTCRCHVPDGATRRREARAALVVAALTEFGFLTAASALPTEADINEAAMYLAARSRHPRYTQVTDGWKTILTSTRDIEMAFNQATKNVGSGEQESLVKAKTLLLDYFNRANGTVLPE